MTDRNYNTMNNSNDAGNNNKISDGNDTDNNNDSRVGYAILGEEMLINKNFKLLKVIHTNDYSTIGLANFIDAIVEKTHVAIKKYKIITNIKSEFDILMNYKKILREIKLLNFLRDTSFVIQLYDIDIICKHKQIINMDIYLYEEAMETDLNKIIKSNQYLSDLHYQKFLYQILSAVSFLHSSKIVHGDIKPSNILVNSDCQIKLTGFSYSYSPADIELSDNNKNNNEINHSINDSIISNWYRAPELMLRYGTYTESNDIWSVGCILAELFSRKIFFKAKDNVSQLNRFLQILGTPADTVLDKIRSEKVRNYIKKLGIIPRVRFKKVFPTINYIAIDLLEKLLQYEVENRITVISALKHRYLELWHDPREEIFSNKTFDFNFENITDLNELQCIIIKEISYCKKFSVDDIQQQLPLGSGTSNNSDSSNDWMKYD